MQNIAKQKYEGLVFWKSSEVKQLSITTKIVTSLVRKSL